MATDPLRTSTEGIILLLDQNVVSEWNELLTNISENPSENTCEGRDSGIIDSCPHVQKLMFFMRVYYYYLGVECACDEDNDEKIEYNIESMTDTVNGLDDMDMLDLLEIFEHVSTVHFEDALFEYFEEEIGKCGDVLRCHLQHTKKQKVDTLITTDSTASKNKRKRGWMRGRDRGRDRNRDRGRERGRGSHGERGSNQSGDRLSSTGLNRMNSMSHITVDEECEEKNTISFFEKWHSFLFHHSFEMEEDIDIDTDHIESDVDIDPAALEMLLSSKLVKPRKHNKFVTDVTEQFINCKVVDDETYYEYGFGHQIKYHEREPRFQYLKAELIGNEVHAITEDVWSRTLMKALTYWDTEYVQQNYRANRNEDRYGVVEDEAIGIECILAILFYCNFDELQRDFCRTFRKMKEGDTAADIIRRHCDNFYWFGRALFVAINFYGERMEPATVVWHGLSQRMLFNHFATYVLCRLLSNFVYILKNSLYSARTLTFRHRRPSPSPLLKRSPDSVKGSF